MPGKFKQVVSVARNKLERGEKRRKKGGKCDKKKRERRRATYTRGTNKRGLSRSVFFYSEARRKHTQTKKNERVNSQEYMMNT